jgi:F-type H+-transporting ATPase subunit epsilon
MRLKVVTPVDVIVDSKVGKITAEAENGSFCLLPRHVDFVAALVPGLLLFEDAEGAERLLAVNDGILVKCGPEVLVSTIDAFAGEDLGALRRTVEEAFSRRDERERTVRSAAARIEAGLARRFVELERLGS